MEKMLIVTLVLLCQQAVYSQDTVVGRWKTVDENTGEVRSVVELYEQGGKVYGKVVKIFPGPEDDPDPVCTACPEDDHRYNKKILGMEIIQELEKDGDEFTGGTVLDPETGKIYRCKLWRKGNDLMIRGYWGPFFRTQTWEKDF